MSGAIRDVEKLNSRQLETVKRRNERELRTIAESQQNLKAEIKKANMGEIVEIQDQHNRHIDSEAAKKEKVLAEMRTHLQQTTDLTDKQLKALKTNAETASVETQRKLSHDRERINGEHELYLEELNDRYTEASKSINLEGKKRVDDMNYEMNGKFNELEDFHQNKINTQTEDFTTRFKTDGANYKKLKDDQDGQFKKERMATNTRQQTDMAQMTEGHNTQIEKRDETFRKGLKEQDLFFEGKYKNTLDRHNADYKNLDDKHQKVISSMKTSLTKEISQTASKVDDAFYKFEALKPKMTRFEDRVEISVAVPEHSKSDIRLTTNGKEAILSFSRRYVDANKTPEGVINKINKVESFTTRLATDLHLDSKSVKSNYEDGTMTYVIKKA